MLQARGEPDLAQEALRAYCRGDFRPKDLEGDRAVVLEILGEVHPGHPAVAKFALNLVVASEGRLQVSHEVGQRETSQACGNSIIGAWVTRGQRAWSRESRSGGCGRSRVPGSTYEGTGRATAGPAQWRWRRPPVVVSHRWSLAQERGARALSGGCDGPSVPAAVPAGSPPPRLVAAGLDGSSRQDIRAHETRTGAAFPVAPRQLRRVRLFHQER